MIRYIQWNEYTIASDGANIRGLWYAGQKYDRRTLPADAVEENDPLLEQCKEWLTRYFAGAREPMPFSLRPEGTPFQQRVWAELCKIPYGQTVTYGELAKALNCRSAQAVGGAVGKNPIMILIPCHRVVGAKGQLTGFAGGLALKQKLLEIEK